MTIAGAVLVAISLVAVLVLLFATVVLGYAPDRRW